MKCPEITPFQWQTLEWHRHVDNKSGFAFSAAETIAPFRLVLYNDWKLIGLQLKLEKYSKAARVILRGLFTGYFTLAYRWQPPILHLHINGVCGGRAGGQVLNCSQSRRRGAKRRLPPFHCAGWPTTSHAALSTWARPSSSTYPTKPNMKLGANNNYY